MQNEPITFSFITRLTQVGIERSHQYLDAANGGGGGEGRFVPLLHLVLDANKGNGFSSDYMRGALNVYLQDPELVKRIAALWWERGLQSFDHKPRDWEDKGRVKFRITVEEVVDDAA